MKASLSVLVFLWTTTWTSPSVSSSGSHGCVPSVLPGAKAPSWPIPHDVTVDATKLLDNITSSYHANAAEADIALRGTAMTLLAKRPELVAVMLAAPHQIPLLAFNRQGNLIVFRNRTSETELFWHTVDTSRTGWAPPFRECTIVPGGTWLHAFVVKSASSGAVGVFLPVHIDQCNEKLADIFGGKHQCDETTTKCVSKPSSAEPLGGYRCICRPGYFYPNANASWQGFSGTEIENGPSENFKCLKCPEVCDGCEDSGVCLAKRDFVLKTVVLAIQLTCMGITLILALIIFRKRKCKTISSGMWTVLETILLGIFLLYSTVVIRFFEPSVLYCILEPWARELGFIVCYGAIILKLYRHLIEFRTRKAHRWIVKDTDLLKYLFIMIMSVLAYVAGFTAITLNFLQESFSLLTRTSTPDGLQFQFCKPLWWDYITELVEITILVVGIQLSFASRNASTQFQERRFLCASICVELSVSLIFYVLRAIYMPLLHPDHVLLAYFIRSQLTQTVVVFILFMPKLWYQHKQARSLAQEYSARIPVDAFKADVNAHGPLAGNNSDVEVGEVTLADMSPDDIRAELKRLYMQLEILKNKTIRADNPHISKRRGGRKVAHRRFSLQKKGSKEKNSLKRFKRRLTRRATMPESRSTPNLSRAANLVPQDDIIPTRYLVLPLCNEALKHARAQKAAQDAEAEASRTPEDSVCSVEGPSVVYSDMPSNTYTDLLSATSTGPSPRPQ